MPCPCRGCETYVEPAPAPEPPTPAQQALALLDEIDLDDPASAALTVAKARNLLVVALSTPVQTDRPDVEDACRCGGRIHPETQECLNCGLYYEAAETVKG